MHVHADVYYRCGTMAVEMKRGGGETELRKEVGVGEIVLNAT